MKMYDKTVGEVLSLIGNGGENLPVVLPPTWPDEGRNQLIFSQDAAYELGGGQLSAIGGVCITEDREAVGEDEIVLLGKDLPDLRKDTPYARIALIRVKEGSVEDTNHLYKLVRAQEYVRYHLYPQGFMMRISSMKNRETVRLRKSDLQAGLSFDKVGSMFLEAYHRLPEVEAVKLIFVTDPAFDYDALSQSLLRSEQITQALDHLVNKVNMDCHSCALQEICEEVEKML